MAANNRKVNLAPYVGGQFPGCVNEVLAQISTFIKQHGQKWARVKAADLQAKIDHDLFCLSPDRRSSKLNELQRLKLMGMLCTFFAQEELKSNRLERHMLFEVIFCGREGETLLHDIRISFLIKWTVIAVQYPVYPLFEDIAQWLHKVGSGKTYAERVVGELLDKFILIPNKYTMYEYVSPLRAHALPFALFFLVHSLSEHSLCVPLITVLGQWLSSNIKGFIDLFREQSQLAEKFATQKFDLLLEYDNKNGRKDEVHDRLHYSLTLLLGEWVGFSGSSKDFLMLSCTSLLSTLPHFPSLSAIAQQRVAENVENALRIGHISVELLQPKLPDEFFGLSDFAARFDGLLQQE